MLVRIGVIYMEFAHAHFLSNWNRQYFRAVLFDFGGTFFFVFVCFVSLIESEDLRQEKRP